MVWLTGADFHLSENRVASPASPQFDEDNTSGRVSDRLENSGSNDISICPSQEIDEQVSKNCAEDYGAALGN